MSFPQSPQNGANWNIGNKHYIYNNGVWERYKLRSQRFAWITPQTEAKGTFFNAFDLTTPFRRMPNVPLTFHWHMYYPTAVQVILSGRMVRLGVKAVSFNRLRTVFEFNRTLPLSYLREANGYMGLDAVYQHKYSNSDPIWGFTFYVKYDLDQDQSGDWQDFRNVLLVEQPRS